MVAVSKRMAVVGVGRFGSIHCSKIKDLSGVSLCAVMDVNADRVGRAAERFGARAFTELNSLVGQVDAAVVAVPTPEHHPVARRLLDAGLDLLVEKPLAATVAQAEDLVRMASDGKRFLQVGHLERYNPILREALPRIRRPRYLRFERLGPWPQQDVCADVVLELMTHDLDLLSRLTDSPLEAVSANGHKMVSSHWDLVSARLRFADGLVVDLCASRVHKQRRRVLSLLDEDGMMEVDLDGQSLWRSRALYGDVHSESLQLEQADALLDQDRDFVQALDRPRCPSVGGPCGADAVRFAERILSALEQQG